MAINDYISKGVTTYKPFDINTPIEELEFNYRLLQFKKIKKIFHDIGDKNELFKYIIDEDIGDNYICYNQISEYGHYIKICEKTGEEIYNLFLSDEIDDVECEYITTFWNNKTKKGLSEKIYSNRTEHYIDGKYHSTNFSDEIMILIRENTKMIMKDKKYPSLYKFISLIPNDIHENISLIPKKEFE